MVLWMLDLIFVFIKAHMRGDTGTHWLKKPSSSTQRPLVLSSELMSQH